MKIGYCQINVKHSDIDQNLKRITELLRNVSADLIVLPELCLTGNYFANEADLLQLSNDVNQARIMNMFTEIARKNKLHLVAGIAEKVNRDLYNTSVIVGPNGFVGKHRKMNLTKNELVFSRGTDLNVLEIANVKIGMAIGFDSWFPESFRVMALRGAQIICCPSNIVDPRTMDILRVRSLENKVFTVMCNRIGSEIVKGEKAEFRGESQVIDHAGNVLIKADQDECVGITEINPNEVKTKENIMCDDMNFEISLYQNYVSYEI